MANENNNIQATTDDSQIVLYQPDESISLQVKIEEELIIASATFMPSIAADVMPPA